MELIKSKTILQKVTYGFSWYGIDYNMNLYRGCHHGCIYCDSRSECYHNDPFEKVRVKENALMILEKELMIKRKKGVVGIGAMSDTYNRFEEQLQLTRSSLQLLLKYRFGVSIDTKSDLILRDKDLLKQLNKQQPVIIKITITTPYDELSKKIEPHVCVSSKRFQVVKELADEGLFVGIMLNPILPFITDDEESIVLMVQKAYESGAKFIHTYMGLTLRDQQRNYYYEQLDQLFPGLRSIYERTYGNQYICSSKKAEKLYALFIQECQKYHLLYRMEDIINAYKIEKTCMKQLSLF